LAECLLLLWFLDAGDDETIGTLNWPASKNQHNALALFGRRPVERANLSLLPASKNQHNSGRG
jgi:hypothetical protein